jgi:hypothetical protein
MVLLVAIELWGSASESPNVAREVWEHNILGRNAITDQVEVRDVNGYAVGIGALYAFEHDVVRKPHRRRD